MALASRTGDTGTAKRILVTGSRGKSSVVRLLRAGLGAAGIEAWARITGIEPRELGPAGERAILRSSGAHVGEMRWWLRRLPPTAGGVVLENSAITPDLQGLAARWLRPHITVLSNVLPDHQEAWGPTREAAATALAAGLPAGGRVVIPSSLEFDPVLAGLLAKRRCLAVPAQAAEGIAEPHRAHNLGLALTALRALGVDVRRARQAMLTLAPDRYDFRIVEHGGAELAMAFSVNDLASTRALFRSLRWPEEKTRLVFNHRADRPGRLDAFAGWLRGGRWREVLLIGDRPRRRPAGARYLQPGGRAGLLQLFRPGDRVFGCGNIAGLPMDLY